MLSVMKQRKGQFQPFEFSIKFEILSANHGLDFVIPAPRLLKASCTHTGALISGSLNSNRLT